MLLCRLVFTFAQPALRMRNFDARIRRVHMYISTHTIYIYTDIFAIYILDIYIYTHAL